MDLANLNDVKEQFQLEAFTESLNRLWLNLPPEVKSISTERDPKDMDLTYFYPVLPYLLSANPSFQRKEDLTQPARELIHQMSVCVPSMKLALYLCGPANLFSSSSLNEENFKRIPLDLAQVLVKDTSLTWFYNAEEVGPRGIKNLTSTQGFSQSIRDPYHPTKKSDILLGVVDPVMYLSEKCVDWSLSTYKDGSPILQARLGYLMNPKCERYIIEEINQELTR